MSGVMGLFADASSAENFAIEKEQLYGVEYAVIEVGKYSWLVVQSDEKHRWVKEDPIPGVPSTAKKRGAQRSEDDFVPYRGTRTTMALPSGGRKRRTIRGS